MDATGNRGPAIGRKGRRRPTARVAEAGSDLWPVEVLRCHNGRRLTAEEAEAFAADLVAAARKARKAAQAAA
jgi:hypothetical protein